MYSQKRTVHQQSHMLLYYTLQSSTAAAEPDNSPRDNQLCTCAVQALFYPLQVAQLGSLGSCPEGETA